MVIVTAANIVVHEWQRGFGLGFRVIERYFVHTVAQNGGDVFIVHSANVDGAMTGCIEALITIVFAETEQPKAGAIAMFRVTATLQLVLDWCSRVAKIGVHSRQKYAYIELNPVRAGMVSSPEEYGWSSYVINGLGKESLLVTPHAEYLNLGKTHKEQQQAYRELFQCHLDTNTLNIIRDAISKGLALGNDRFKNEIESNLKRRVTPLKVGRKRKKITLLE